MSPTKHAGRPACRKGRGRRLHALGLIALSCCLAQAGKAESTLERMVEAGEPCKSLEAANGIAVDRFRSFDLRHFELRIDGAVASLSLDARLDCQTSSSAIFPGHASARVEATASINLDTCKDPAAEVGLSGFEGAYGVLLSAARPQLEAVLTGSVRDEVRKACTSFGSAGG
jgi:hypothetical protein